jgi:hypothetical protein
MQIIQHSGIVLAGPGLLICQNATRTPGEPGKKQQKVIFQAVQGIGIYIQWFRANTIIRIEIKTGDTAVSRDILILFANRLAQSFYLDMAGHLCQFLRVHQPALEGAERPQQGSRKTAR